MAEADVVGAVVEAEAMVVKMEDHHQEIQVFASMITEAVTAATVGPIVDWKTELLEWYYSHILQIYTEVQERGQFQQFYNVQNISLIIRKLPVQELDK